MIIYDNSSKDVKFNLSQGQMVCSQIICIASIEIDRFEKVDLISLSLSLSISLSIYILSSIDCFVVSRLFSVATHARFPKLGSKPG